MMGIYIKSMEMPNSCLFCPLNSMKQCRITGGDITWAIATRNRRGDCPLVPIQPHGRLGDLDELENGLRHMAKYQHGERQQGILGCCETIRSAPAIIEASNKDVDATVKEET